jgi:sugar lactone lactonase YvrE
VGSRETNDHVNAHGFATDEFEDHIYVVDYDLSKVVEYTNNNPRGFIETSNNNGSVTGEALIYLSGPDSFTNAGSTLTQGVHYDISNLSAGLTSSISVNSDGRTGTLNISGNATSHGAADNIENLVFDFQDAAFSNNDVSLVGNSTSASSYFTITFDSKPSMSVASSFMHGSGKTNVIVDVDALDEGATAPDENITYSISGTDSDLFSISTLGELTFKLAPIFDIPSDDGLDNVYDLIITASSNGDTSTSISITIVPFDKVLSYLVPMSIEDENLDSEGPALYVGNRDGSPTGITFNSEGTMLYMVGDGNNRINQYELTTPFDLSTAFFDTRTDISGTQSNTQGIAINADGSKIFIVGYSPSAIHEYSLSTPGDIGGGITLENSIDITPYMYLASDLAIDPSGSKLFLMGNIEDLLFEFSINLPSSLAGGIELVNSVSVGSNYDAIAFSPDGTQLFLTGRNTGDYILQYEMGAPYDVSGGITQLHTWDYRNDAHIFEYYPEALTTSKDGRYLYFTGSSNDSIYQVPTGPADAFVESDLDDGSVERSLLISIAGDSFENSGGSLVTGSAYDIQNLPNGLSSNLTVNIQGNVATLELTGSAIEHDSIYSIDSLLFDFYPSAFISNNLTNLDRATSYGNGLGITFIGSTLTSFSDQQNEDFQVYPNPVSTSLHFSAVQSFTLLDAHGRILKEGRSQAIDMADLSPGYYVLKMQEHSFTILKE